MLLLLGDELIRDAGLAVFELVKNAYDADASSCNVTLSNITDPSSGSIIIEDNGTGMDLGTVTVYGWSLERIAVPNREKIKNERQI